MIKAKQQKIFILCIITLLISSTGYTKGNQKDWSFSTAKKKMYEKVYYDHQTTFYCDCPYENRNILPSEKFKPSNKYVNRAKRVEGEHIVPAENFGKSFKEYRDPGCDESLSKRACAAKTNKLFKQMLTDLYNIVPANGQVNAMRSNFSYAMIPDEQRIFGDCDMEIENRKAEPKPDIRGDIARVYMYMNWAYPGRGIISKKNRKLFDAWNKSDPVDEWERERAKRIELIQGNKNPFVMDCKTKLSTKKGYGNRTSQTGG